MFDDWGMFAYTNGAFKPWGDYLTEIDVGIWEMQWDDETWAAWVDAKREIARVSIESGGSISACHGSCREGEVDLVPLELGGGFDVMKKIKRTLDPRERHEPGQVPARPGLRGGGGLMLGFRLVRPDTARGEAHHRRRRDALRAHLRGRPGADDRARPPAGPPGLGHACGSSTSRWEHLAWMHDHFADSVDLGRGAPEGDRGGEGVRLAGKSGVVTGTSRGLGREILLASQCRGRAVVALARNAEARPGGGRRGRGRAGGEAVFVQGDVRARRTSSRDRALS